MGATALILYAILGIAAIAIYLIPTWIAIGKENALAIFLVNLFFGVTGLGWLAACIWACVSPEKVMRP